MRNYAPAARLTRRGNSECGMRNAELLTRRELCRCTGTGGGGSLRLRARGVGGRFDAERERVLTGACACGRRGLRESCNFGGENCKYSLQNARENCKEQI